MIKQQSMCPTFPTISLSCFVPHFLSGQLPLHFHNTPGFVLHPLSGADSGLCSLLAMWPRLLSESLFQGSKFSWPSSICQSTVSLRTVPSSHNSPREIYFNEPKSTESTYQVTNLFCPLLYCFTALSLMWAT